MLNCEECPWISPFPGNLKYLFQVPFSTLKLRGVDEKQRQMCVYEQFCFLVFTRCPSVTDASFKSGIRLLCGSCNFNLLTARKTQKKSESEESPPSYNIRINNHCNKIFKSCNLPTRAAKGNDDQYFGGDQAQSNFVKAFLPAIIGSVGIMRGYLSSSQSGLHLDEKKIALGLQAYLVRDYDILLSQEKIMKALSAFVKGIFPTDKPLFPKPTPSSTRSIFEELFIGNCVEKKANAAKAVVTRAGKKCVGGLIFAATPATGAIAVKEEVTLGEVVSLLGKKCGDGSTEAKDVAAESSQQATTTRSREKSRDDGEQRPMTRSRAKTRDDNEQRTMTNLATDGSASRPLDDTNLMDEPKNSDVLLELPFLGDNDQMEEQKQALDEAQGSAKGKLDSGTYGRKVRNEFSTLLEL
jgi:hypothetical protein